MRLNPDHRHIIHRKSAGEEQLFLPSTEKRHSVAEVMKVDSRSD